MATLDLEDAYFLVPIFEGQKILAVSRKGLAISVPAWLNNMSMLPKSVIAYLRSKEYQSVIYLDDFLLLGSSVNECRANLAATTGLQSLGFIINFSKSQMQPSSTWKYLGFIFNSVEQSISIPPHRRRKLLRLTHNLASRKSCSKGLCQLYRFAYFRMSSSSIWPSLYQIL